MSDTPDRSGPFNGGTGRLERSSSCEDPATHSYFAGVEDQETASTSAPSEDFSDLFDYHAYYAGEEGATDVTSQSDAPSSEGKPAARPSSALVPAGASAASPNHDEDSPMPDAPSQGPQPPHVWPEVSGPHPPRDTNILLESSPSPPPATEMHLDGQSPATSPSSPKRKRTVKDPEETGRVRELRSCYHCKMNKKACGSKVICDACSKRPFPKSACIRTPPSDMIPPKFVRWNWNDAGSLMPGREQFVEDRGFPLLVSCSDAINSPCLELQVRPFALPNQRQHGAQGHARLGISPTERRLEHAIYPWMEQQILAEAESKTGFEPEMDKLLLGFARRSRARLQQERHQIPEPLLSNLLRMRCMWKIWSCKQLFFRQQPGSPAVPFDLRFASIQDSLRLLAGQAISELERRIMPQVETYLAQKETAPCEPAMRPATHVMKWVLLWQLILIYRQSLNWMLEQQQTNAAPISIAVAPMNVWRHTFREETRRLFEAIIVIYSEVFQKKTTVERIKDAAPQVFGDDCELYTAYQKIWQMLPDFYRQVSSQVSPTDELFIEYIVTKESDILAKARPSHK